MGNADVRASPRASPRAAAIASSLASAGKLTGIKFATQEAAARDDELYSHLVAMVEDRRRSVEEQQLKVEAAHSKVDELEAELAVKVQEMEQVDQVQAAAVAYLTSPKIVLPGSMPDFYKMKSADPPPEPPPEPQQPAEPSFWRELLEAWNCGPANCSCLVSRGRRVRW